MTILIRRFLGQIAQTGRRAKASGPVLGYYVRYERLNMPIVNGCIQGEDEAELCEAGQQKAKRALEPDKAHYQARSMSLASATIFSMAGGDDSRPGIPRPCASE